MFCFSQCITIEMFSLLIFCVCYFLQWRKISETVYYEKNAGPMATLYAPHKNSPRKRIIGSSVEEPSSKRVHTGSTSAPALHPDGGSINVTHNIFSQLEYHLAKAYEHAMQFPTTCSRLDSTAGLLPSGHNFDKEACKDALTMESMNITSLQANLLQIQGIFQMLKSMQDARCKPFEDDAQRYLDDMNKHDDAAGHQMHESQNVSHNLCFLFVLFSCLAAWNFAC